MTDNKELLDELKVKYPKVINMTYTELGIFLEDLGFHTDWVSLGEAHDYLGGYKNEKRDSKFRKDIDERWKKVFG